MQYLILQFSQQKVSPVDKIFNHLHSNVKNSKSPLTTLQLLSCILYTLYDYTIYFQFCFWIPHFRQFFLIHFVVQLLLNVNSNWIYSFPYIQFIKGFWCSKWLKVGFELFYQGMYFFCEKYYVIFLGWQNLLPPLGLLRESRKIFDDLS